MYENVLNQFSMVKVEVSIPILLDISIKNY